MKNDIKRVNEVLKKYRNNCLMELDSLENVIECSLKNYDFMIDFAIKEGFKTVVDIGCAFGHQSELCKDKIEYIGIDEDKVDFYGDHTYLVDRYPSKLTKKVFKNCLAISNLAIGWNCYVNEKEFDEQCKALKNDFKASLLYIPKDREEILKKNFENIKIVKEGRGFVQTAFYYCK